MGAIVLAFETIAIIGGDEAAGVAESTETVAKVIAMRRHEQNGMRDIQATIYDR